MKSCEFSLAKESFIIIEGIFFIGAFVHEVFLVGSFRNSQYHVHFSFLNFLFGRILIMMGIFIQLHCDYRPIWLRESWMEDFYFFIISLHIL